MIETKFINYKCFEMKLARQWYLGRVVVTEAGSYLRLIDFCITQLKAQGPSRTCNESKEEEEGYRGGMSKQGRGARI